jgi:hypothetical protein
VLELEFKWDFRTGTKTFVEKMEVATFYESERQSSQARGVLPAASPVCLQFWRRKDVFILILKLPRTAM